MRCILSLVILGVLLLFGDPSWARREALTADQKSQMERIDRVLITVIALSDKGAIDAGPLIEVAATRMKEFGYTPVTDPTQPHDVELKIKCEQKRPGKGRPRWGAMPIFLMPRRAFGKGRPANSGICSTEKNGLAQGGSHRLR